MRKDAGQITIEAVLVLTLLVTFVFGSTKVIKDQQFLTKIVSGPWAYMAGMIENGYWAPVSTGLIKHPNQYDRHGSPRPDSM